MANITYINGVEYKDETQYNKSLDEAMLNTKIRKLNKRIESGKKATTLMQRIMIILAAIILGLVIANVIQGNQYQKLHAEYDSMKSQYDSMKKEYAAMAVDYAGLKSDLEQYQADVESMNNDQMINVLADISVQYSAYPGFVYNESIPLDEDIQQYAFQKCAENGINYQIFLGLMRKESSFNPNAKSGTNDYGLCQINICNHETMKEVFGSDWDWSNPYDSIDASTYMLGNLVPDYSNWHHVLMAYNAGARGAKEKYFNKGIYSTEYSRTVLSYAKEYGYTGDGTIY